QLYETILGIQINKRNFRTKILKLGVLKKVELQTGVAHRPAFLYKFDKSKYQKLQEARYEDLIKRGVDFDI
ncbi:MAG: NUDIX hydrolase, partial [Bacteroidota bacterium]